MAIASVLVSVGALIAKGITAIATSVSAVGVKALVAKFIFGGIVTATSAVLAKSLSSKSATASSPTYQSTLCTQTNPELPLPIIYGTVKCAGNVIWQSPINPVFTQKIVAFAEGEISDFSDIRINDIPVSQLYNTSVQKYFGTSSQDIAAIVPGNSQFDKSQNVGSLKNVAYLAITTLVSEKVSNNYNLTAIVKGKKVRVYSSPVSFSFQYSENPAWVLFDFLTCYNGLGLVLNDSSEIDENLIPQVFDMESFLEAAAYCDELVNGKPRFTFNMIFDSQTSVRNLLDEIYRSCRGGLFFKNGLLQFKIDKPEPISKVFSQNDIANEVFNAISSEEHSDIFKCIYISPQHEWQKVEAFAEIENYRNGPPVENSVNIFSCTNFEQASRLAWYYANSKTLQPYYGSFDTDFRAYDLEVGDVIKFDSILMGINNFKVKVTQVVDDGAGTFTVSWQSYDERLYQDVLGSLEPRLLVSKLNDLSAIPDDVLNFNVIQSKRVFNFSWDKMENVSFEIRKGNDWKSASIIAKNLTDNFFSCEITDKGINEFFIKAKNNYNYSENATSDLIFVDSIPEKNIVLSQNILSKNGSFFQTSLYHNTLKLLPQQIFWQNLQGLWNEIELDSYQLLQKWGSKTYDFGYFISEIFDLGKNFNNYSSVSFSASGNYEIFFRYSDDITTLENLDFIKFSPNQYSYRFVQFKIALSADFDNVSLMKNIVLCVDVPDKTANYSIQITNADNGYLLDYSNVGFFSVPSIVATVTNSTFAYAITADKTTSTAKIFAVSNDGSKTTANIDLQLFGY